MITLLIIWQILNTLALLFLWRLRDADRLEIHAWANRIFAFCKAVDDHATAIEKKLEHEIRRVAEQRLDY